MTGFLDQLLAAGPGVVLAVVGVVVFIEDALFVGFVVPGETAALLGGVAAQMRAFDNRGPVWMTRRTSSPVAAAWRSCSDAGPRSSGRSGATVQ